MNLREVILDILLEWEDGQVYSHILLQNVLQKYDYLESRDKAFVKRVTQGTIERKIQIDYVLNLFSSVPVSKMKRVIRNLLRCSVYQLLYMDSVPDSAVCNEAVKLASKRKFGALKGYVNGVLRQIARKKEEIVWPDRESEPILARSIQYSLPEYLVEQFMAWYGEEADRIMEAFLEPSPLTIRYSNALTREEQEKLEQAWEQSGVQIKVHPYGPEQARILEKTDGIASLEGFAQGAFVVQDISSMMVCNCAGITPGMEVIDVCAAPGGKAMHAAQLVGGEGIVRAYDVSESKVQRMLENRERMGLHQMQVGLQDATFFCEELVEQADVVLADVPCSGLGVIKRKQDIKYRIDEKALEEVVALQKQILSNVWQYVKKGGIFMYSTCTMNPKENEEMVEWLEANFPLKRETITPYLPEQLRESVRHDVLQMKPGIHLSDGFFLARLRRM